MGAIRDDDMIKKTIYKIILNKYLRKYESSGYQIISVIKNGFKIKYMNKEYILKITNEGKELYLCLTPYKNSYFKTYIDIKELAFKLNMTLFAVKENEILY